MKRTLSTATIVATCCASLLLSTGTSYAYYVTDASGTGQASVGGVGLSASTIDAAGLLPGGSKAVAITVRNTDALSTLVLTSLTLVGSVECGVTFTADAISPAPLLAGAVTTLTGVVSMSEDAESSCQGKTLVLPLLVKGRTA